MFLALFARMYKLDKKRLYNELLDLKATVFLMYGYFVFDMMVWKIRSGERQGSQTKKSSSPAVFFFENRKIHALAYLVSVTYYVGHIFFKIGVHLFPSLVFERRTFL